MPAPDPAHLPVAHTVAETSAALHLKPLAWSGSLAGTVGLAEWVGSFQRGDLGAVGTAQFALIRG
jgi:hypothetical protein